MKYTKDVLKSAVINSKSISEVLRFLGIEKVNGGNHTYISNRIKHFDIDTNHFLGQGWTNGCKTGGYNKKSSKDILVVREGGSNRESSKILRRAMIEEGVNYSCSNCGISEWDGKEIRLEIDHINGNGLDNRLLNLRFLCPNCHSQTANFRNYKKNKKSRESVKKKCEGCEDGYYTRSKYNLCRKCSSKKSSEKKRVVERPTKEDLSLDIGKLGYAGAGRKYGVNYKTIQKWEKVYQ